MLEVLISIIIASIVTSFLVLGILGAQRINSQSEDMRNASTGAEEKIEELRRLSYGAIVDGADSTGKFQRVWTVTEVSAKPRIKDVELVVTWEDSKGISHQVTYNTTYYRNAYPYK